MRNIVMPGDIVAQMPMQLENAYVDEGKTYSKILGMYEEGAKLIIPLEGAWNPRIDDLVVGVVVSAKNFVYEVDLSSFMRSILIGGKFDTRTYKPGEVIEAIVKDVEDRRTIILDRPRTLYGGSLLNVKAVKIPRIIGKNDTMIGQIANATKCTIVVGKNGNIWLKGGDIALATYAIKKVENEAHTSGLTEKIKVMLENSSK